MPVLGHRVILRPESRLRKISVASVLREILDETKVPVPASQERE
jgi:MoxR-like ATPase